MDVKTLCLGVLAHGPASGYEIRKWFEEGPFGHFQDAAFGSIYPALRHLSDDGMVTVTAHPQESRPEKKVYAITPTGRSALLQALMRPPGPDKLRSDFTFVLFFGHALPPEHLNRIIDARIADLKATIDRMEGCTESDRPAGHAFTLGYGLAIYRAALQYLERNRHTLAGSATAAPEAAD